MKRFEAPWVCDECIATGDSSHCVRPAQCNASIEARIAQADFLRDVAKERSI